MMIGADAQACGAGHILSLSHTHTLTHTLSLSHTHTHSHPFSLSLSLSLSFSLSLPGVRRGSVLLEVDGRPLKGLDLPVCVFFLRLTALQGYLAHKSTGPPQSPRHSPTVGS